MAKIPIRSSIILSNRVCVDQFILREEHVKSVDTIFVSFDDLNFLQICCHSLRLVADAAVDDLRLYVLSEIQKSERPKSEDSADPSNAVKPTKFSLHEVDQTRSAKD